MASISALTLTIARASAAPRDPSSIARGAAARQRLHDQTAAIADRLATLGMDVYRPSTMATILPDGSIEQRRMLRDLHILPERASATRREIRLSLRYYMDHEDAHAKRYARYWVLTGGQRVPIGGIEARKRAMEIAIARWNERTAKPLGLDPLLLTWEMPIKYDDGTAHVHGNLLIVPRRILAGEDRINAIDALRTALGAHIKDNGICRDIDELIKYVTKPEDVIALSDDNLLALAEAMRGMRLVCPLGPFRAWRQGLEAKGLRITSLRGKAILVRRGTRQARPHSEDDDDEPAENLVIGIRSRMDPCTGISSPTVIIANYTSMPTTGRGRQGLMRAYSLRHQAIDIANEARRLDAHSFGSAVNHGSISHSCELQRAKKP